MNNEELMMNNEKYKCFAFDVGAGPVSAQKNTNNINKPNAPNAKDVGACDFPSLKGTKL